jgi:hypothetical protein
MSAKGEPKPNRARGRACLLALCSAIVAFVSVFCMVRASSSEELSAQFQSILDTLALRPTFKGQTNEYSAAQEAASNSLRTNASAIIPFLSNEVELIAKVETTNRDRARELTERLAPAFREMGAQARPLMPQLVDNLQQDRAVGASMVGLQSIGGIDAGMALVTALTNSDPITRNGAMSFLSGFSTNSEIADQAYPLVLVRLKDTNAFTRGLAATTLGEMRSGHVKVVPELEKVILDDVDPVVRWCAMRAVGRFGTNALSALATIEAVLSGDKPAPAAVRKEAQKAFTAITGKKVDQ